jgi:hypothetical protein
MQDALYVLDVNNWTWSIPKVSGDPPPLVPFGHRVNVIGNYMVITFGKYFTIVYLFI